MSSLKTSPTQLWSIFGTWEDESAVMTMGDLSMDFPETVGKQLVINEDGAFTIDSDAASYKGNDTHDGITFTLLYSDGDTETLNVDKLTKDELILYKAESAGDLSITMTYVYKRVA